MYSEPCKAFVLFKRQRITKPETQRKTKTENQEESKTFFVFLPELPNSLRRVVCRLLPFETGGSNIWNERNETVNKPVNVRLRLCWVVTSSLVQRLLRWYFKLLSYPVSYPIWPAATTGMWQSMHSSFDWGTTKIKVTQQQQSCMMQSSKPWPTDPFMDAMIFHSHLNLLDNMTFLWKLKWFVILWA